MDVRSQITFIEHGLIARGLSVAQLCRRADLAQTTWQRWKGGAGATRAKWDQVEKVLGEIAPELRQPSASSEAA